MRLSKCWRYLIRYKKTSCVNCEHYKLTHKITTYKKHIWFTELVYCKKLKLPKSNLAMIGHIDKYNYKKSLNHQFTYIKRAEKCPFYFPMYSEERVDYEEESFWMAHKPSFCL